MTMGTETVMEPKKKQKGGRKPGILNKRTRIGKDVSETLKNWLGFDDASVERTGMIDGEGYAGRQALRDMWDDKRVVDPRFVALAKFLFSYAYGLPGRATESKQNREQLVFGSTTGYLFHDPRHPAAAAMDERSRQMNEAKAQEEKLLALEAAGEKAPVVIDTKATAAEDDAAAETLESVNPDDPSAFGGGGRGR